MQIENSRPRWGIVIGLFVALGALAALPFLFYQQPKDLPIYQVHNFMGSAELYSAKGLSRVPVQRGDSV